MGFNMSLTKAQFKETAKSVGAALLATTFIVANANAAEPNTIEIASLDLNKPVPTNICVESNSNGKAWDKLTTIMNARNQIVVATADQAVTAPNGQSPYKGKIFTSDSQGDEGYIIVSDVPKAQTAKSPSFCLTTLKSTSIYNAFSSNAVPAEVNQGELGIALRNNAKAGLNIVMTGTTPGGALIAVNYNPKDKDARASLKSSDNKGNTAGDLAYMVHFSYTPKAKQMLGIVDEPNIALNSQPQSVALAKLDPKP